MDISKYLKSIASIQTSHKIDPAVASIAQEMRNSYRALIPSAGVPDPVGHVENIEIPTDESNRTIPARLYTPLDADRSQKLPIVIFIHGGGWVSGDLDTHDVLIRAICNGTRSIVLSVGYRLAPEHPFPAGLEDVYVALQWMNNQADHLGGDKARIAVVGDSAGGNLATALTLLLRTTREFRLVAQWLMYPVVGNINKLNTKSWQQFGDTNFPTKQIMNAVLKAYIPTGIDPYMPLVAPLWGTHEYLPPALLQVGEHDPLRDEATLYSEALLKAGVDAKVIVYQAQQHGFIQFFKDKTQHIEGEAALNTGIAFLRTQFNRP